MMTSTRLALARHPYYFGFKIPYQHRFTGFCAIRRFASVSNEKTEQIRKWDVGRVVDWARSIDGVRETDVMRLYQEAVAGGALLTLTVEVLEKLGFPYGPALALANAVTELKKVPIFELVPLPDSLRIQLKDPDNCLIYKTDACIAPYIHVGVKRVAATIAKFVNQSPDATQRKNLIFVVGSPKSGKTAEAMVVVPHLLEPNMDKLIHHGALPCKLVYIDCASLVTTNTLKEKLRDFYDYAADALNQPPRKNSDTVNLVTLKQLFRSVTHKTIVVLDEYQMLLANLSGISRATLANYLRDTVLDPSSPCQFVVTGSTGAALMASLEESIQNGISMFKGAAVVTTDLNSPEDELSDVQTMLTHFKRNFRQSPIPLITNGLGFVNCASVNVVSVLGTSAPSLPISPAPANTTNQANAAIQANTVGQVNAAGQSIVGQSNNVVTTTQPHVTPTDSESKDISHATKEYGNRIMSIYKQDYEAVLKYHPAILQRVYQMALGNTVQPIGAWATFVDSIKLESNKHLYLLKEPLFASFIVLQTVPQDDGTLTWRNSFAVDLPLFDTVLLVRLIPLVEAKQKIDVAKFESWYNNWPKDNSKRGALLDFLANSNYDYWKKKQLQAKANNKLPAANHPRSHWRQQAQSARPLELLRLIRNATVPHEASPEGVTIQEGAHLFIAYFGKGVRSTATQFIKIAQTYM